MNNNTPANSPATLSAFKKRFPSNNNMNTPPPSPCSTINKTPKGTFTSPKIERKSSVNKRPTNNIASPFPDIAKFHVSRPLTPSTCSEKSEQKFSFQIDKNQVEENCKKPIHARLGLNISSLNSSFYDLSKALTNPKPANTSVSTSEKTPPESFIAAKKYKVPPRSSSNEYVVSFDSVHKKGVVSSSDHLDPLSKPIKKTEALTEKRKILAQKLSLATRGASFSPISRVVKKEGSFDSLPSTPTSTVSLPDEAFRNVIQSGCVNDVMSKDIERTAQEGNQSIKDLLMNGYFLHSGRCVDLEALQQDIFTQILMEDANANVEELSPFFKLNVVLQLSYLPCTSYFNVQLERTCSMVGNVVKGLSIENDMRNVSAISDRLNEELSLLDARIRDGDPNLVYSMNTSTFPTSTYIEKEEDLQTSIEKLGAVHGCIITCILRMKLNGITQKDLSKLPRCFRNSNQYFLAKLICNDNLNRQFLSQGIWQLLSLELFDSGDSTEEIKEEESQEIATIEPADNLEEEIDQSPQQTNSELNMESSMKEENGEKENETTVDNDINISSHQREATSDNHDDEFSVENAVGEQAIQSNNEPSVQGEVIEEVPVTNELVINDITAGNVETTSEEPIEEQKEESNEEPIEDNISTDSSAIVEETQEGDPVEEPEEEPIEDESSDQPQVYIQQTGQEIFNLDGQMVEVSPESQESEASASPQSEEQSSPNVEETVTNQEIVASEVSTSSQQVQSPINEEAQKNESETSVSSQQEEQYVKAEDSKQEVSSETVEEKSAIDIQQDLKAESSTSTSSQVEEQSSIEPTLESANSVSEEKLEKTPQDNLEKAEESQQIQEKEPKQGSEISASSQQQEQSSINEAQKQESETSVSSKSEEQSSIKEKDPKQESEISNSSQSTKVEDQNSATNVDVKLEEKTEQTKDESNNAQKELVSESTVKDTPTESAKSTEEATSVQVNESQESSNSLEESAKQNESSESQESSVSTAKVEPTTEQSNDNISSETANIVETVQTEPIPESTNQQVEIKTEPSNSIQKSVQQESIPEQTSTKPTIVEEKKENSPQSNNKKNNRNNNKKKKK